jgi:hypothetical protein
MTKKKDAGRTCKWVFNFQNMLAALIFNISYEAVFEKAAALVCYY